MGGAYIFDVRKPACVEVAFFEFDAQTGELPWNARCHLRLLSNHFRLLLKEPAKRLTSISDVELVSRIPELEWTLGSGGFEMAIGSS